MKAFYLSYNSKNGQYYISLAGTRDMVIYQDFEKKHFVKSNGRHIYLTDEQVTRLNEFRKTNQ
jgi:hypothetical protein